MNKSKYRNEKGSLLTYEQIAEEFNLGIKTVMIIAKESGALIKIGKTARVIPEIFFDYIKKTYGVPNENQNKKGEEKL